MNSKVIVALIVVLILVVVGGGFLLVNRSNTQTAPIVPIITPETTPTPETQEKSQNPILNETEITLSESGFTPKSITIKAGDKVIWTNNSGKMATVDSAPHPIHTSYPEMNLGNFDDGEKLELVFPKAGTYNYHNHLNASQGGSITVE